jgi:hypothetical protein
MKSARRSLSVNLENWTGHWTARPRALSEADYGEIKGALHALAAMLVRSRNRSASRQFALM